jgi:RNA polymerase sigma-70 factor (ECF subfamily)
MQNNDATAELVKRWQGGDSQAAQELFARYSQRLVRLAEQHLSRKVAGRLDGEDVVQSVFRTFFRRSSQGEFRIDTSSQLWRLLVQITLRKARAKGREHTAAKRDVAAEAADGDALLLKALTREPGPDEAAAFMDQIETLLRGLPELHGRVLEMRLQGYSPTEISQELHMARMSVYRVLRLLQERLLQGDADATNE